MDSAEKERVALNEDLLNYEEFHKYLSDMSRWRTKLNSANAAHARAAQLAASDNEGLLPASLRDDQQRVAQHLQEAEDHWETASRLDRIRMESYAPSSGTRGGIDHRAAEREYAKVIRDSLGVDLIHDDEQAIAARLFRSPIKHVLVATLDHWATYCEDVAITERLLSIARKVDSDPMRDQLREQNNWNRATLDKLAQQIDPAQHSPLLLLMVAEKMNKMGSDGASLLRSAIVQHPQDFWLHYTFGNLSSDPTEKIGCYKAAIAVRPNAEIAHNNWAVALARRGDDHGAIAHFKRSLEINPNHDKAHFNLGLSLMNRGDLDEAIAHFEQATKLNPVYAKAYVCWGDSLAAKEDYEGAIQKYQKILALDSNYAPAHMSWGVALDLQGNHDRAIEQYKAAIAIKSDYVNAHANWAVALMRKGDLEEAIKKFEHLLEILPPNHDFRPQITRQIEELRKAVARESVPPSGTDASER